VTTTVLYPEPDNYEPHFLKIHINVISSLCLNILSGFLQVIQLKGFVHFLFPPVRATSFVNDIGDFVMLHIASIYTSVVYN
jgi:hypothetical protein